MHLFVGPPSFGKTTLVNELCKRYGYKQVISCTDQPKRHLGEDGYIFLTEEEFTTQRGWLPRPSTMACCRRSWKRQTSGKE